MKLILFFTVYFCVLLLIISKQSNVESMLSNASNDSILSDETDNSKEEEFDYLTTYLDYSENIQLSDDANNLTNDSTIFVPDVTNNSVNNIQEKEFTSHEEVLVNDLEEIKSEENKGEEIYFESETNTINNLEKSMNPVNKNQNNDTQEIVSTTENSELLPGSSESVTESQKNETLYVSESNTDLNEFNGNEITTENIEILPNTESNVEPIQHEISSTIMSEIKDEAEKTHNDDDDEEQGDDYEAEVIDDDEISNEEQENYNVVEETNDDENDDDNDDGNNDEEENDDDDEVSGDNESVIFRTHTDTDKDVLVEPKFNKTVRHIQKEIRLVAECPDVTCEFGYLTDLNGKTLCTCYDPCENNKCGSKICIIKKINNKFQGLCVDPQKIERPYKCHLPVAKGRCRNYESRFYYNPFHQACEHFVYRGCHGNENNFNTWHECDTECNVCSQPPATGPCRGHIIRYYYERSSKSCIPFSYGGCLGNKNNFESHKKCQDTCL